MANNLRKLRVAFLLTPSELARRMRADAVDIERLERQNAELAPEWVHSIARALGVPEDAVTDPGLDVAGLAANGPPDAPPPPVCPIATRYAILACVAKFAGVGFAAAIDEDSLARAVQSFFAFIEDDSQSTDDINRQTLALQIAVLAILQARGFEPNERFAEDLRQALAGSIAMMRRFAGTADEPAK